MWYHGLEDYFISKNDHFKHISVMNGLFLNLSIILCGPLLGDLIDKHDRIKGKNINVLSYA